MTNQTVIELNRRIHSSRHKRPSLDPMAVVRLYLFLLVFSPSIYVIGPLGAAGTPAGVLGCLMLALWLLGHITRSSGRLGQSPLNWATVFFTVAVLLSFYSAMTRPAVVGEVLAADRGLISVASWLGVILYLSDTMRTRARMDAFLRFATLMGAALAAMGIVQFIWHIDFVSLLHWPGLVENSSGGGIYQRDGYIRVAGTATHSIEFAAVLGTIFPVSIYVAVQEGRNWIWRWAPVALILAALPLTVARSGMIALGIGLVFAVVVLHGRRRLILILIAAGGGLLFKGALPGFLGVLRDLFLNAGQDSSVGARVADYAGAEYYFSQSPLFGRGLFTFLPTMYRTFDNQYLGSLIETGIVGLLALIGLVLTAIFMCVWVAIVSPRLRLMAISTAVGVMTAALIFYTFDALGFPMMAGIFCVLVGSSGGVWRNMQNETEDGESIEKLDVTVRNVTVRRGISRQISAISVLLFVAAFGVLGLLGAKPVYEARYSFTIRVGDSAATNVYFSRNGVYGVSYVVSQVMVSQRVTEELSSRGVSYYVIAIGTGSLEPFTDVIGNGDLMSLISRSTTPKGAQLNATTVLDELEVQLNRIQNAASMDVEPRIAVSDILGPDVYPISVHKPNGLIGLLVLLSVLGTVAVDWVNGPFVFKRVFSRDIGNSSAS